MTAGTSLIESHQVGLLAASLRVPVVDNFTVGAGSELKWRLKKQHARSSDFTHKFAAAPQPGLAAGLQSARSSLAPYGRG